MKKVYSNPISEIQEVQSGHLLNGSEMPGENQRYDGNPPYMPKKRNVF